MAGAGATAATRTPRLQHNTPPAPASRRRQPTNPLASPARARYVASKLELRRRVRAGCGWCTPVDPLASSRYVPSEPRRLASRSRSKEGDVKGVRRVESGDGEVVQYSSSTKPPVSRSRWVPAADGVEGTSQGSASTAAQRSRCPACRLGEWSAATFPKRLRAFDASRQRRTREVGLGYGTMGGARTRDGTARKR